MYKKLSYLILLFPLSILLCASAKHAESSITYDGKNLKEIVIAIDPGHGGIDYGTCYGKVYEKDINLDIALKYGKLLKQAGIKNVYTRSTDTFVGLRERASIANNSDALLFISIHNNTLPKNPEVKGTEALYYPSEIAAVKKMDGKKLADIVQKELVKKLGTSNNGTIKRPNLAVLRLTKMPAVIAEVGYISNRSDRTRLSTPEFRQRAAVGLYEATLKALKLLGVNKSKDSKWTIEDKP